MDEVFLTIKGERHYLWRAVDQDGTVLDILVQRRRDKQAAKKFFRKLLKGNNELPSTFRRWYPDLPMEHTALAA
jgi:putative transposase